MCTDFRFEPLWRASTVTETTFSFTENLTCGLIKEFGFKSQHSSKRFHKVSRRLCSFPALAERHQSVRGRDLFAQLLLRQVAKLPRNLQALTVKAAFI